MPEAASHAAQRVGGSAQALAREPERRPQALGGRRRGSAGAEAQRGVGHGAREERR
jgi:hypothetical protein